MKRKEEADDSTNLLIEFQAILLQDVIPKEAQCPEIICHKV